MTKIYSEWNAPSSYKSLLKETFKQTASYLVMLRQAQGYWNIQLPFSQFNLHWRQIIAIKALKHIAQAFGVIVCS